MLCVILGTSTTSNLEPTLTPSFRLSHRVCLLINVVLCTFFLFLLLFLGGWVGGGGCIFFACVLNRHATTYHSHTSLKYIYKIVLYFLIPKL